MLILGYSVRAALAGKGNVAMDYLWTPWRYQYMAQAAGGEQPDCIFCEAVAIKKASETFSIASPTLRGTS